MIATLWVARSLLEQSSGTRPIVDRYVVQGLPIAVEFKAGTNREGVNKKTGVKWTRKMYADYGEIFALGTEGTDGDPVDVYVGPDRDAPNAYVIDQLVVFGDRKGEFDEQKVMLGCQTADEAKELYLKHMPSAAFFGGMKTIPVRDLVYRLIDPGHRGERL